jgi:hypothetical protein
MVTVQNVIKESVPLATKTAAFGQDAFTDFSLFITL